MDRKKDKKSNVLLEIFDVLFIMLLCFGTLLTAVIMEKGEAGGTNYSIHFTTFAVIVMVVVLYLCFILSQSDKGLRAMIHQLYGEENT